MKLHRVLATAVLAVGFIAYQSFAAEPATSPSLSADGVLEHAPASAWRDVPPEDLLIMHLANGTLVAIQLAPKFAPVHVENIRRFVKAGTFNNAAVTRVQDNYVVQWTGTEEKPLPPGVVAKPPQEYEGVGQDLPFRPLGYPDTFASQVGYIESWPAATDGKTRWLVHCYGIVGAGRDLPPDTGSGIELYAVLGQSPRHLDRNLAVVGRVLAGMETLASLPRGPAPMGFYTDPGQRTIITKAQMASDMPTADRPAFQVLDSASPTFNEWVKLRASRDNGFNIYLPNVVDICNAMPPVRRRK